MPGIILALVEDVTLYMNCSPKITQEQHFIVIRPLTKMKAYRDVLLSIFGEEIK